jgi:hypothetical protein
MTQADVKFRDRPIVDLTIDELRAALAESIARIAELEAALVARFVIDQVQCRTFTTAAGQRYMVSPPPQPGTIMDETR